MAIPQRSEDEKTPDPKRQGRPHTPRPDRLPERAKDVEVPIPWSEQRAGAATEFPLRHSVRRPGN